MVAIVAGNGLGLHSSSALLGEKGQIGSATLGNGNDRVYVNAATGNLFIQDRDQLMIGRGPDSAINRVYNSLGQVAGDNWQPGMSKQVYGLSGTANTAGSTVRRIDWDGADVLFNWDAARQLYVASEGQGTRETLSFDSAAQQWTWRDAVNQVNELYDASQGGRLASTVDRDGNAVSYRYNAAGLLSQVETASGESTFFDYNGTLLTQLRSSTLNGAGQQVNAITTRYSYDSLDRLASVVVDLSPDDSSIADGNVYTTRYTYDGASSRMASITESDGSSVAFAYQLIGDSYRVTSFSQASEAGVVRTTTLKYDLAGRSTKITDPLGFTTDMYYNAANQLTMVTGGYNAGLNSFDNAVSVAYNANGSINTVWLKDIGQTAYTTYAYDARGNIITETQVTAGTMTLVTTRTYDADDRVLTESVHLDKAWGVEVSNTRYVYDGSGHLRFVVSAEGRVTEYRYNSAGQQSAAISYAGAIYDVSKLGSDTALTGAALAAWVAALADKSAATRTDTSYDFRGNVASVTSYGKLLADGTGDAGAETLTTRYVYDQFGRLLQRLSGQDGSQWVEHMTYDGLGRVLSATRADGSITLYQYDDAKHQQIVTLSNGLVRTSLYNLAGELIGVTESSAGKLLSAVQNVYDSRGNLRMSTDANGLRTHYIYDALGRQVAEITPEGKMTEFVYPIVSSGTYYVVRGTISYALPVSAAKLTALVGVDGKPKEWSWNGSGSADVLALSGLRPAVDAADRREWRMYDSPGVLTASISADGTVSQYTYNSHGQLALATQLATRVDPKNTGFLTAKLNVAPTPGQDRVTRYIYDKDGLLRAQLDGEGYLTEFRYNAAGQKTETIRYATLAPVQSSTQWTAMTQGGSIGALLPAATAQDIHQYYRYDARGLLRSEIDGEGFVTSYTYDANGNVASRVQGQQLNPAQLTSPQQVNISFQASAVASGGVWPQVEVWVDGVKVGSATINSSGLATYNVTASNLIPIANHTVDLVFVNADGVRSVTLQNGLFGNRPFGSLGSSVQFDEGVGSAAFDGITTRTQAADAALSLSTNGAARYALDAAQTALYWAGLPGVLEQTFYEYDAEGRLVKRSTYGNNYGEAKDSAQYVYDSAGRLVQENRIDAVSGEIRSQHYRYDVQGRLTGQLGGEGSAQLAALGANASQAALDAVWQSWGVSYQYDSAGLRSGMIDANGKQTRYYYNGEGQLTHTVNATGGVTEYQYNPLGDLTQTIVYATLVAPALLATLTGGLISSTLAQSFTALGNDGQASRTSFTYTANGQLASRTEQRGGSDTPRVTTYSYNSFGQQTSVTQQIDSASSVTSTVDYDRLGQVVKQTTDTGGLNLITQAIYDAFGRVVQSIDANGNLRSQQYDRNGNTVVVTDGSGNPTQLSYDAFGNVLTRTDGNGHTTTYRYGFNGDISVTTPEGIVTTTSSNAFGQTIKISDGRSTASDGAKGNTTTFTYDLDGNLIKIVDPRSPNGVLNNTYDHAGLLIQSLDTLGIKTTYTYDAVNRVLTRTVSMEQGKQVTHYAYDAKGQTVSVTDPSGVQTVTQYNLAGEAVLVTVDPAGLHLQTGFSYDGMGNMLTTTQGVGSANPHTTQYVYDKNGRLVSSTVDPAGLKLTTGYTYDNNGNVVAVKDAAGTYTRYVYDANNRQQYSIDGTGAVVQTLFDNEGNLIARNAFANKISLTGLALQLSPLDVSSQLVAWPQRDQSVHYVYDQDNRLTHTVNAQGYVTQQVYDASGNVIQNIAYANPIGAAGVYNSAGVTAALNAQTPAQHALDRVTLIVYDNMNAPMFIIDAAGYITKNVYDGNSNLVSRIQYATPYNGSLGNAPYWYTLQTWVNANALQPAQDRTTSWIYDSATQSVLEIDPEGYATQHTYDAAGRITGTIRYAENYSNLRGMKWSQALTLLPATVPNSAAVTTNHYDTAGRLDSTTVATGTGNVTTTYQRDALGKVINATVAAGTAAASTTHYDYDAAGRLLQETRAYGTPVASTTRYAYDGVGRMTQQIDPRGVELTEQDTPWALAQRAARGMGSGPASNLTQAQKDTLLQMYATRYDYDALGQVTTVTDALGGVTRTSYDAFGNVALVVNPLGLSSYFYYDKANHTILLATSAPADAASQVIQTEYDAFGNPVKVTQYWGPSPVKAELNSDPGALLPVAYRTYDRLTQLTYDKLDRLIQSTDAQYAVEDYGYDAFGNRTSYINKNRAVFSYSYDRRGLLLSETLPITANGQAVVNRFSYDAGGNRIEVIEAAGLPEQRITSYGFDLLGRQVSMTGQALTTYTVNGGVQTVTPLETRSYDARGNLVTLKDANGGITTWYYDAGDRRTAEVSSVGTLSTWSYDAAGNPVVAKVYATPVAIGNPNATPVPANPEQVRETQKVYDANSRLIESRVKNVTTGFLDPSLDNTYAISDGDIVQQWQYDALGNAIVYIDPNGNRSLSFYNPYGYKVLEVDAQGYGTYWQRDFYGNASSESRFATRFPDPITVSSNPADIGASWPRSPDDRITQYVWDKNDRLLSESRLGVKYATVGANGVLSELTGEAKTTYSYDAEGHLLRKTDANGSQYDFAYDAMGRQTSVMLPQFQDYLNRSVRSTTEFTYDGLGNVTSETLKGIGGAADQVTVYHYTTGGRLLNKVNAMGVATGFQYDAAGNVTSVTYQRANADGLLMNERAYMTYDAAGREISRNADTTNAATGALMVRGAGQKTQYNAFGEITGRHTGSGSVWQEYAEYDNAGRVVRTNFNDGVSHVFMYDRNGNATLKVESMEVDLRLYQITNILKDLPLNQTFTAYDSRNQVISIQQPKVWAGAPVITFNAIDLAIGGGKYDSAIVDVGGWLQRPAGSMTGPSIAISDATIPAGVSLGGELGMGLIHGEFQDDINGAWLIDGVLVSAPDLGAVSPNAALMVRASYYTNLDADGNPTADAQLRLSDPVIFPGYRGEALAYHIDTFFFGAKNWDNPYNGSRGLQFQLEFTLVDAQNNSFELGAMTSTIYSNKAVGMAQPPQSITATAPVQESQPSNQIVFQQGLGDGKGVAYYRPQGSSQPFSAFTRQDGQGNAFAVDASGLPDGAYEMVYLSTSADGTLQRRSAYVVTISHSGASTLTEVPITQETPFDLFADGSFTADQSGTYVTQALPGYQGIAATGLRNATGGILADGLQYRLRAAGSNDGWGGWSESIVADPATGMFNMWFLDADAQYDMEIALFAGGAPIGTLDGTVSLSAGAHPRFRFDYIENKHTNVRFTPPQGTAYIAISYTGADGVRHVRPPLYPEGGAFNWNTSADGLIPNDEDQFTYAIEFTTYDQYGTPSSMSRGDITLGAVQMDAAGDPIYHGFTLDASETPTIVQFNPVDSNNLPLAGVASLTLFYRPKQALTELDPNAPDSTAPFASVSLVRGGNGKFQFDASALAMSTEYEYRYLALDADGNVLAERASYFLTGDRHNPATNTDIIETIPETGIDALNITRYQTYNAFGEVASEIDGRKNITTLSYNTLGKLILKQEPTVSITLPNGFIKQIAPQTVFYYDRTGNLLGVKDANGNLSRQTWNYGTAQPSVAQQWDADGNSTVSSYDSFGNLRLFADQLGRFTSYEYDQGNRLTKVARPQLADGTQRVDQYSYDSAGNRITHTDALGHVARTYYDQDGRITQTVSAAGRRTLYQYAWDSSILSLGGEQTGGWRKTTIDANGMTMVDQLDQFGRLMWHQDLGGHTFTYGYNWAGLLQSQAGSSGQNVQYSYYSNGYLYTIVDAALGTEVKYEYDPDGNRNVERTTVLAKDGRDAYILTQAEIAYDGLNRVTSVKDLLYSVSYEYDAVGNRVHMQADYHDVLGSRSQTQEYWYQYDRQNRFTVTMGQLSTGQRGASEDDTSVTIVVGNGSGSNGKDGVGVAYDAAGNRKIAYYSDRTETYDYDENGYLTKQYINGQLARSRVNDLLGRVTEYLEYDQTTGQVSSSISRTYDHDNLQLSETDNVNQSATTFTRMADGTLKQTVSRPTTADGKGTTIVSDYSYEWWDGAKQSTIKSQASNPDVVGQWNAGTSTFNYDVNGNLSKVHDDGGGDQSKARAFTYNTDLQGQVLQRNELVNATVDANGNVVGDQSGKIHNFYYVNGHRIGNVGSDGIEKVNYIEELAGKLGKGDDNSQKVFSPLTRADFDENYMAINGAYPAITPGGWTVRTGDTLQSIAQAVWGDSTLWYILAEANGLKSTDTLKAGQQLTVPNKVTNIHNTASTFKPYDPGQAIGNTNPTLPNPPPPPAQDNGCSSIGALIAIIAAVVVTVFTAGAALAALAPALAATAAGATFATVGLGTALAAGAIAGAAGAIVGQGISIAVGNQDSFSWKGVAMGAIGGAITGGVANYAGASGFIGGLAEGSSSFAKAGEAVLQGGLRSVVTQGIGVATGAQHSFNWKDIAVSAISAGAGNVATQYGTNAFTSGFAASTASTLARGGSVGKNIGAIALDGIAATVGAMVTSKKAEESLGKNSQSFAENMAANTVANPLLNAANNATPQPVIYGQVDGNQLVGGTNFQVANGFDDLPANYMAAMNAYGGQTGNLPTVAVNANNQTGVSDRDMAAMAAQMNSGLDLSKPMSRQEFLASAVAGDNAAPGPWQQHQQGKLSAAEAEIFNRGSEMMQAHESSPGVVAYRQHMAAQHAEQQGMLADLAGGVSTLSGRVAASATAYAQYFSMTGNPYGEGAALIQEGIAVSATVVGFGAGAAEQILRPNVGQTIIGTSASIIGVGIDKVPGTSFVAPLSNEILEAIKNTSQIQEIENWINNKGGKK